MDTTAGFEKTFTFHEIVEEILMKTALFGVIKSLCSQFGNVEVIEHYGNYIRMRVARLDKSIGFLFKMMQEIKDEHQLEDYSVSATTLEQIF